MPSRVLANRYGRRKSRKSVMSVRLDDDDDCVSLIPNLPDRPLSSTFVISCLFLNRCFIAKD